MKNQQSPISITKISILLLFLALSYAAAACNYSTQTTEEPPLSTADHEVDVNLRRMYRYYGGVDLFGRAISELRYEGDELVQYTETMKMLYNSKAPVMERFRLAPLGVWLALREPDVPQPEDESLLYVDGHVIHPIFVETYRKLESIIGKPLTEARKNVEYHRIEQLFENIGLSYDLADGKIRLLAYGVAMCDSRCRKVESEYAAPLNIYPIDPTFRPLVDLRGVDYTGYAITPAYYTPDGRWQQIFEYLVLSADGPNQVNTVRIEPIARIITYVKSAPGAYSGSVDMHFVPVQGELGYEIPLYFWEYLQAHGGLEVSGAPVSSLRQVDAKTSVQCFTNLCLEYDLEAVVTRRVHPVGLGYPYKDMFGPLEPIFEGLPVPTPQLPKFVMNSWAILRTLDTRLQQEIGVFIAFNNQPVVGIMPVLTLTLPDGSQQEHRFPPTDAQGQSILRLPLIQGQNNDLIYYTICVVRQENEQFCIKESFLIWNNP